MILIDDSAPLTWLLCFILYTFKLFYAIAQDVQTNERMFSWKIPLQ